MWPVSVKKKEYMWLIEGFVKIINLNIKLSFVVRGVQI